MGVFFVGVAGFEPATSWSQTRRDNRATLHPELINNQTYKLQKPAERGGFEPPVRFDPYDGLANRSFRPLRHLSLLLFWKKRCKVNITSLISQTNKEKSQN